MYDVVIIGAGVVGAMIARLFSKYEGKVLIVDKESDIAMGATKANSAIVHAGVSSILVLSGEATMDDVEKSDVSPTHILENIKELYEYLREHFA